MQAVSHEIRQFAVLQSPGRPDKYEPRGAVARLPCPFCGEVRAPAYDLQYASLIRAPGVGRKPDDALGAVDCGRQPACQFM